MCLGYRILYDNGNILMEHKTYKRNHRRLVSVLLICLLAVGSIKLIGWDIVKDFLLPGDPEVTESAFFSMVESIRTGESVKDAITAFCTEIIAHAK